MGSSLLVAVLLLLRAATWAAPEQTPGLYGVPVLFKFSDKTLVPPGQSAEFLIMVDNPQPAGDTWLDTVVTDTVDSNLKVTGVGTSQGYAGWTDGYVTFAIGTMPPGRTVNLTIYVEVKADAPQGCDVYNTAYMKHVGWGLIPSDSNPWMFRIAHLQHMPLTMRRCQ